MARFLLHKFTIPTQGRPRRLLPLRNLLVQRKKYSRLTQVSVLEKNRFLKTDWKDGTNTEYPFVWLRDNCQCKECQRGANRILQMKNFDPDIEISSQKIDDSEDQTTVTWTDGHTSTFQADWLWKHRFTQDGGEERQKWFPLAKKLWSGQEMRQNIPSDTYTNILTSDRSLLRWICHLERDGLFYITDAPTERGRLKDIAERVAFLKPNHYGFDMHDVKAKVGTNFLAFSSSFLGLHTDQSYTSKCPEVQMLHCIKQTPVEGGDNLFADGFYAAEQLRRLYPEHFETLTRVPVDYMEQGNEYLNYFKINSTPVIRVSKSDELCQIVYNDYARASVQSMDKEDCQALYSALKAFSDILHNPKTLFEIKLNEGEIMCFNNHRVLHGRNGYQMAKGGERLFQSGYMEEEEFLSRRRVLQQQHGFEPKDFLSL